MGFPSKGTPADQRLKENNPNAGKANLKTTDKPWNGSASNYPDANAYCDACLIDTNTGDKKVQANCSLPVYEPDGTLNTNAVGPATAALAGARGGLSGVSPSDKKAAARKLVKLYNAIGRDVPESLKNMAQ